MNTEHGGFVMEHTKLLTEIDARSKSNTKRLDNMEKIVDAVHEMNGNIKVIVEQTKQQQGDITTLIESIKNHEDRIDVMESKDDKHARKVLMKIQWLIISLLTSGIFYLLWDNLMKGGTS